MGGELRWSAHKTRRNKKYVGKKGFRFGIIRNNNMERIERKVNGYCERKHEGAE